MKLTARGGKPVFAGRHVLLPADKVRHVGEPVAVVVAETRAQAMDAAEAVAVEYDELPYTVLTDDALTPGRAPLWDEAPDNVLVDMLVRRPGEDRPRVREGRTCGQIHLQHRPRHRGDDGAALVRSATTTRRPVATRSIAAAAAQ